MEPHGSRVMSLQSLQILYGTCMALLLIHGKKNCQIYFPIQNTYDHVTVSYNALCTPTYSEGRGGGRVLAGVIYPLSQNDTLDLREWFYSYLISQILPHLHKKTTKFGYLGK